MSSDERRRVPVPDRATAGARQELGAFGATAIDLFARLFRSEDEKRLREYEAAAARSICALHDTTCEGALAAQIAKLDFVQRSDRDRIVLIFPKGLYTDELFERSEGTWRIGKVELRDGD